MSKPSTGEGFADNDVKRPAVLSLSIKDTSALYAAYMPYLKNGGLFIPTTKRYHLGEEVFMLLSLIDSTEKLPIAGQVVWITPPGAQGRRHAGVGIHFHEKDAGPARSKIETLLGGKLKSSKSTHTL